MCGLQSLPSGGTRQAHKKSDKNLQWHCHERLSLGQGRAPRDTVLFGGYPPVECAKANATVLRTDAPEECRAVYREGHNPHCVNPSPSIPHPPSSSGTHPQQRSGPLSLRHTLSASSGVVSSASTSSVSSLTGSWVRPKFCGSAPAKTWDGAWPGRKGGLPDPIPLRYSTTLCRTRWPEGITGHLHEGHAWDGDWHRSTAQGLSVKYGVGTGRPSHSLWDALR